MENYRERLKKLLEESEPTRQLYQMIRALDPHAVVRDLDVMGLNSRGTMRELRERLLRAGIRQVDPSRDVPWSAAWDERGEEPPVTTAALRMETSAEYEEPKRKRGRPAKNKKTAAKPRTGEPSKTTTEEEQSQPETQTEGTESEEVDGPARGPPLPMGAEVAPPTPTVTTASVTNVVRAPASAAVSSSVVTPVSSDIPTTVYNASITTMPPTTQMPSGTNAVQHVTSQRGLRQMATLAQGILSVSNRRQSTEVIFAPEIQAVLATQNGWRLADLQKAGPSQPGGEVINATGRPQPPMAPGKQPSRRGHGGPPPGLPTLEELETASSERDSSSAIESNDERLPHPEKSEFQKLLESFSIQNREESTPRTSHPSGALNRP